MWKNERKPKKEPDKRREKRKPASQPGWVVENKDPGGASDANKPVMAVGSSRLTGL